jgi:hypothetical protein
MARGQLAVLVHRTIHDACHDEDGDEGDAGSSHHAAPEKSGR